ncbi:hypothetical protein F7725_010258 [Dissostichus mawsoni]|uniref:Uncharacterized protein n=1 Tax=Dissostichus mawsoni TaxID=36200 RepID=A0A7J5XNB9_DISMA|nr:hypothetical protein F7725_010258 [Dissostichus mawsoni]
MSTSGHLMSTSGVFMSPFIFGIDMSTSPLSLGPFRLKSTFGMEMFGTEMVGILKVRSFNINISFGKVNINVRTLHFWTFQAKRWHFDFRHFKATFWPFNINRWTCNVNIRCFNINARFRKVYINFWTFTLGTFDVP